MKAKLLVLWDLIGARRLGNLAIYFLFVHVIFCIYCDTLPSHVSDVILPEIYALPFSDNKLPSTRASNSCPWTFHQSSLFQLLLYLYFQRYLVLRAQFLSSLEVLQIEIELILCSPLWWLRIQFSGVCSSFSI